MGRIIDDDDILDIKDAMGIYEEWKQLKEKERMRREIMDQDLKKRWAEIEMVLEKSRLQYLQGASIEVLMAIAKEPAQLDALYKAMRLRTLATLPPDKAAILMMEDKTMSADVAKEIILAIHQAGKTEQYERLILELKESSKAGTEAYEKNLQRLVEFFNSTLRIMGAVAGGKGANPAPGVRFCANCGGNVSPNWKVCPQCGRQLGQ